jgi:cell division protease FtsH
MNDVSSGASGDIMQVTSLAKAMIEEWGMSAKLGFVRYAGVDDREMFLPDKQYSEDTQRMIDEEVKRLVDEAYRDAEQILFANWDKVVAVAEALLKYETLSSDDVHRLMRGEQLTKPSVADMLVRQAAAAREASKPKDQGGTPEIPPGAVPA